MRARLQRRATIRPLLLGALMLAFALLQFDDPDPAVWVGYYGLVACACTVAGYRPMPAALFWGLGAATAAGLAWTAPGFLDWLARRPASDLWAPMSADRMHIEHSREFLGLLIAAACLLLARRLSGRQGITTRTTSRRS